MKSTQSTADATPTLDEIRTWPATVDLPTAARALGISRSQMYALVKRGEAPVRVLDYGTKRVVTASLVRLLEAA
ncbi:DNA-binding protein [Streptomyces variabilis]